MFALPLNLPNSNGVSCPLARGVRVVATSKFSRVILQFNASVKPVCDILTYEGLIHLPSCRCGVNTQLGSQKTSGHIALLMSIHPGLGMLRR